MGTDSIEIINRYSCDDAVDDGILFDVTKINPEWKKGMFNYITTNLMQMGYVENGNKLNLPALLDLLNQCIQIVKDESEDFTRYDWLYIGEIELPSGERQKVYIQQNETGKYTIMLPEDY